MTNKFTGTTIEFHILQSFPVSCLNRDDVGSPKSAIVGGTERARVSSQCWKRAVRLEMHNLGIRTRSIEKLFSDKCVELGASKEMADNCGKIISAFYKKNKPKDFVSECNKLINPPKKKSNEDEVSSDENKDTTIFISKSEIDSILEIFQQNNFNPIVDSNLYTKIKEKFGEICLDIALFGRMVASHSECDIQAASSFSHAISTHAVSSEVDFFTVVEEYTPDQERGSAHMGTLEFNSATYYRYVSLDLGTLSENLKSEDLKDAISDFTKALFTAFPAARQATMSAACPWDYAVVTVRKGQRIQLSFNSPVKGHNIPEESKKILDTKINDLEKMYGSLYGLKKKIVIGQGLDTSIDTLISDLQNTL